ncbi:MAG: ABC transporter substrate-binding protein [Burkholderiales bacterium]|nr:ABC transporter substrate-binding protein [Burkholderiales bacterium]
MDPHANNESLNNNQNGQVYEQLTQRDKQYKLIPWLATSWQNVAPTKWIVHLRKGVRFHDGTPFTADDVVFSFDRARVSTHTFKLYATQAGLVRRLDDHTVEFTTPGPNPVMEQSIGDIFIMSKAWAEKHKVTQPQNYREKEDAYSARNAMGTGPFKLVSYQPGVKTLHEKNKDWWGIKEGHFTGNVETVEYRPISNASTRMAALRSGELDFVLDPSVQDISKLRTEPSLKVWEGDEVRIIYIGFDQSRDELLYSDVKGKNPFKDIRVRKALYQAVDVQAIRTQVMRGLSRPTAINVPDPKGAGIRPELDKRLAYDPAVSRKLLTEAGYPNGFGFTLHCPNDRYINDEKICTALAAMWARVGINARVEALPRAQYFPKAGRREVTAFMHGWGGGSSDAIYTLKPIFHSRNLASGVGDSNWGEFKVARLDELIDAIDIEMDKPKRTAMINDAMKIVQDEVLTIPLHHQVIPWVSKASVAVVHRPNNFMTPMWVTIR